MAGRDAVAVRLCSPGLAFVELDEVGLDRLLFDELSIRAYHPTLLYLRHSRDSRDSVTFSSSKAQSTREGLTLYVLRAVPAEGLRSGEARVHLELLRRWQRSAATCDEDAAAQLQFTTTATRDVRALEVEVELHGTDTYGAKDIDHLMGTTKSVFTGALRRRLAGKWGCVGCTMLVSVLGKTHSLVVRRIHTEDGSILDSVSAKAHVGGEAPTLALLTRETRWHIVPSKHISSLHSTFMEDPLTDIERRVRTLLELELHRKSSGEVGSGVLLKGVAGVGKWSAAQRIAASMGAEVVEINLASVCTDMGPSLAAALRQGNEGTSVPSKRLFVFRQLELFASPPAEEDASYKWLGSTASSDQMSAASQLLEFMDSISSSPGVVMLGLLRQGYSLPSSFLRSSRFDHTFIIPAPVSASRFGFLQAAVGSHQVEESDLQYLAEATTGYVYSDLVRLIRRIKMNAQVRLGISQHVPAQISIYRQDMDLAMLAVRPSQMFELTMRPPRIHWEDVAGCEEAKRELEEAVKWGLAVDKNPLLASLPQQAGVLLYGPSGCGKTMCAHAFASAMHLPFISVRGPELFSKYLGETEALVRRLFERARQMAPSIIFFDEIDALAPTRSGDTEGMGGMGQRVLSQLLNEMDGISARTGVLLLACSSRPDLLDPALLRPGRLERLVYLGPPNAEARAQLLRIERKRKVPFSVDVNDTFFAEVTNDLTHAEILACCREAALLALTEDAEAHEVGRRHLEVAISQRRLSGSLALTQSSMQRFHLFARNRPGRRCWRIKCSQEFESGEDRHQGLRTKDDPFASRASPLVQVECLTTSSANDRFWSQEAYRIPELAVQFHSRNASSSPRSD